MCVCGVFVWCVCEHYDNRKISAVPDPNLLSKTPWIWVRGEKFQVYGGPFISPVKNKTEIESFFQVYHIETEAFRTTIPAFTAFCIKRGSDP